MPSVAASLRFRRDHYLRLFPYRVRTGLHHGHLVVSEPDSMSLLMRTGQCTTTKPHTYVASCSFLGHQGYVASVSSSPRASAIRICCFSSLFFSVSPSSHLAAGSFAIPPRRFSSRRSQPPLLLVAVRSSCCCCGLESPRAPLPHPCPLLDRYEQSCTYVCVCGGLDLREGRRRGQAEAGVTLGPSIQRRGQVL